MSVTAIGAMNLTNTLHRKNLKLVIFNSLKTIFFLTIKPVNIAINNPPKGSITFDVKLSSRSKNV